MMSRDLPPDLQQKIRNFQVMQGNLQGLNEQKYTMEDQLKEISTAKELVEKLSNETSIYKSIGGLMVQTSKDKAEADLKETEETISARLKKITMTIERTQSKFDELKNEINNSLKNRAG
nr:prefoldin subunit beta [Candidatus Sigynarchaeota archaeon]